jgi:hypothetical protein
MVRLKPDPTYEGARALKNNLETRSVAVPKSRP